MRLSICFAVVILFGTGFASPSFGKEKQGERVKMKSKVNVQVGRDFKFTDAQVGGKYQMGAEGLAQVDQEKDMISLVQPKRDFKDRIRLFGEEN